MRIQQSIQRHLEQALVPQHLEVLNESTATACHLVRRRTSVWWS
jgi:stress-induced morphogen